MPILAKIRKHKRKKRPFYRVLFSRKVRHIYKTLSSALYLFKFPGNNQTYNNYFCMLPYHNGIDASISLLPCRIYLAFCPRLYLLCINLCYLFYIYIHLYNNSFFYSLSFLVHRRGSSRQGARLHCCHALAFNLFLFLYLASRLFCFRSLHACINSMLFLYPHGLKSRLIFYNLVGAAL